MPKKSVFCAIFQKERGEYRVKNCGWYLWLNGRKIYNIRDLRENFDTAVLSGYFLGGSLMKWLSDLGEYSIVKRLSKIDADGDIGRQLEFAFGVSPDKKADPPETIKPINPPLEIPVKASDAGITEAYVFHGSFYGGMSSFSPLTESSFQAYSESVSSFGAVSSFNSLTESSFRNFAENSFYSFSETASSFGLNSSYAAFVSGQAVNMIQSSGSSFRKLFGSSEVFAASGGLLGGSFSKFLAGSYKGFYAGSYLLSLLGGSFPFSSGMFGSMSRFFTEDSYVYTANGVTITAEEYHRTLINLSSCPLNAYGYGINLV